jgi:hypothetical protein
MSTLAGAGFGAIFMIICRNSGEQTAPGIRRNAKRCVYVLIALPFKRCLTLLVTIVASIAFVATVPGMASTSAFAVVLIVLKTVWDVWLHRRERRGFAVVSSAT